MKKTAIKSYHLPQVQGLYDPQSERDSCGVGFVCDIKGKRSNEIISQGLEVLRRLAHRGATGADPKTGDGAGLLFQIPHEFFVKVCEAQKITLPARGSYGAGLYASHPASGRTPLCVRRKLHH